MKKKNPFAICLLSGGLDSVIAAIFMMKLGVSIHAFFFEMPWGCGNKDIAQKFCAQFKIPLTIHKMSDDFLAMLQNPRFGRGSAFNPCIDCKIFMIKHAAQLMEKLQADFIFTGEIIGQRPMSQRKQTLDLIAAHCGIGNRLLRPLCAKHLPPTDPEQIGLIDREQLLDLNGRSRKPQIALAKLYGLKEFSQPAGGCLLTDKNFEEKLQDLFTHGYRDLNDILLLKWGRHFRLNNRVKFILGRDQFENDQIETHADGEDLIIHFKHNNGPSAVIQGTPTDQEIRQIAACQQWFSKYKDQNPVAVIGYHKSKPELTKEFLAGTITPDFLVTYRLGGR